MATLRQKTSFGPGKYRNQLFDVERLRQFAEGTNKAIAAGVPVPLLKRHAKINADDKETLDAAQLEGAGWLTKVEVEEDGALAWEAKDVPEDVVADTTAGRLKFTSPEFRSVYTSEKEGVYTGPIIRHFAFTPLPGNPHQGAIETVALQELPELGAFQFAEEERQPLDVVAEVVEDDPKTAEEAKPEEEGDQFAEMIEINGKKIAANHEAILKGHGYRKYGDKSYTKGSHTVHVSGSDWSHVHEGKKKEGKSLQDLHNHLKTTHGDNLSQHAEKGFDVTPSDATRSRGDSEAPLDARDNPDMPPVTTDKSKAKAVLAGLTQKGIVLPSDFDFTQDSAIDILLAAINSSIAAENKAEAESADDDADDEAVASESAMPFAEQFGEDAQFVERRINASGHTGGKYYGSSAHAKQFHDLVHAYGGDSSIHRGTGRTHGEFFSVPHDKVAAFHKAVKETIPHYKHGSHYKLESSQHTEVSQFSEEELNALPEKARNALIASEKARKEAEDKAAQFAEQELATRNNAAKDKATAAIEAAKLPPGMTQRLLGGYSNGAIQFSEGSELPTFTAVQVAEIFAAAIPPTLRFSEEDVEQSANPKANAKAGVDPVTGQPIMTNPTSEQFFEEADLPPRHISAERAEELYRSNPLYRVQLSSQTPSIEEHVRANTAKNPSQVLRTK